MTYPPQPGQPGQPAQPYGSQAGGFPGQQPYPGGQNAHQGGYQPYGMYPGGPGQQPPKKKTGLIVGISLGSVVVLFGVFAILAWVAPGFLLSDDDGEGGEGGESGSGAQALAEQIMQGFNNQDAAALQKLACGGADQTVPTVIGVAEYVEKAEVGDVQEKGDTATAKGTVTAQGTTMDVQAELKKEDGSWCWQSVSDMGSGMGGMAGTDMVPGTDMAEPSDSMPTESAPTESGGDSGAEPWRGAGEEFVAAINAGDTQKAESMYCSSVGGDPSDSLQELVTTGEQIQLGDLETGGSSYAFVFYTGSVGGEQVGSESSISMVDENGTWCVDEAYVFST